MSLRRSSVLPLFRPSSSSLRLINPSRRSPLHFHQLRTKTSSQEVPRIIKRQEEIQLKGTWQAKAMLYAIALTACGATLAMNNPFSPAYPTIPYPNQPLKGSSTFEQERLSQTMAKKDEFKPIV